MVRHACAGPQSIEEVAECHFFDTLKQHASACCLPGSGSAHMVAVRCRRSGCLQLPVLELLRLPPPSAGGGRLRNVASRLSGVRLGKMRNCQIAQKANSTLLRAACFCGIRQLPIFPGRRQPSIVGVQGLNFCVRDGNRWYPLA